MPDMTAWGTDVAPSMPEPIDESEILVDLDSHVFVAGGLRINMGRHVREEIIASAYLPVDGGTT